MNIELANAGETLAAIVVSKELSQTANQGGDNQVPADGENAAATHASSCANCGTQLAGAYCHGCGQSSHIHRSLLHMFEEVLHGIFHFDTKAWRTVPALIMRPGHLTKEYIQGKRTSYVSPLALFLFLIFLMFFTFSFTMNGPDKDMLKIPQSREDLVTELNKSKATLAQQISEQQKLSPSDSEGIDLREEIKVSQFEIRKLQESLDRIDGKPRDMVALKKELRETERHVQELRDTEAAQKLAAKEPHPDGTERTKALASANNADSPTVTSSQLAPWELAQDIRIAEREIKYLNKQIDLQIKENEKLALKKDLKSTFKTTPGASSSATAASSAATSASAAKGSDNNDEENISNINNLSDIPYFGSTIDHATKNPELTLFKMKKNASGLAFLLMPISLPFLWLLFAFKRKYVMFDHAVFSLYSLSFMCLLLTSLAILSKLDLNGTASLLFVFIPPIHMFIQVRHAYDLGVFSALWRTMALLLIAFLSLLIYAAVVTMLSA